MSDTPRKKALRLCRDCDRKLPPDNPYLRRCVRCAVKNRLRSRRRNGGQPWSVRGSGRQPIAAKDQ